MLVVGTEYRHRTSVDSVETSQGFEAGKTVAAVAAAAVVAEAVAVNDDDDCGGGGGGVLFAAALQSAGSSAVVQRTVAVEMATVRIAAQID